MGLILAPRRPFGKSAIRMAGVAAVDVTAIDLSLLEAFEGPMAERALTRAGQRIGLIRSAMRNALARLRHVRGDDLFVRTPRGMEPAPRAGSWHPNSRRRSATCAPR